ncbi:hypothetical protein OG352_06450 [Streptomyces sp. NBC_01485]|uniref:hypothetical protein n=1 Tax=Streptomyces sp. NBC_01485 TaxID=2903884 RepID=UPI002E34F127|nr:hypothetical protein [Streptomyces sp. NBC_01485]
MNGTQRLLYRHIPSFKREDGSLYTAYVAIYSRIYAARMRYLHRRGRHAAQRGIDPRCSWCGGTLQSRQL